MNIYSVSFFRHEASAYESERAGAGRGVFFVNYLRSLVRVFHIVYPEPNWRLEIRHDERASEFKYFTTLLKMQERGLLKLIYKGKAETLCGAMCWRLDPLWEPTTGYLLCRDLDALPTFRERRSVDRWIASGKPIHAMHDSISHMGTLLMGGMVGFDSFKCNAKIPRPPYDQLTRHGDDQRWLASVIPPVFRDDEIFSEGPVELGPKDHPMDKLGSHLGGAFHVDPFIKWLDENPSVCQKLDVIRECERG